MFSFYHSYSVHRFPSVCWIVGLICLLMCLKDDTPVEPDSGRACGRGSRQHD
jgi:hypothetical protein